MNITEWTWFHYVCITNSVAITSVCMLGSFGNILSLRIFLSSEFRRIPINLFLAALSLSDLILLLLSIPLFSLAPIVDYLQGGTLSRLYWFATVYLLAPAMMAQFMSIWLVVAATVERWMAVCRPLTVDALCTRQKSLIVIVGLAVVSVSLNFVRFFEYSFDASGQAQLNLRAHPAYLLIYVNVCSLAFKCLLPLLIVLVLNAFTIRALFLSSKQRHRMTANERSTRKTTIMLLGICMVFFLCHSFYSVLNVLEMSHSEIFEQYLGYILCDLNNLLWVTNGASSCIFYWIFSTKYRKALEAILCCRAGTNTSYSSSSRHRTKSQGQRLSAESICLLSFSVPMRHSTPRTLQEVSLLSNTNPRHSLGQPRPLANEK